MKCPDCKGTGKERVAYLEKRSALLVAKLEQREFLAGRVSDVT